MRKRRPKNRTNVRFLIPLLAVLLSGCASEGLPLGVQSPLVGQRCSAHELLICERFGPERRCECSARTEVTTMLPDFGAAAWHSGEP
jgi:hypothetical protein